MMHPDNKLRILAVDDSRTNLLILKTFLQKLGHEVTTADNGKEAIAHFDREQPDIILMDIMMPVMDGLEATRQIKTRPVDRWIPIVFLSALDRDEHLVEGLEAGGDDYLTKPINFVVLEAKIRSMQRSLMLQQNAIESYKRLQAISDNVLEAIITIDTSGIIQASNQATEYIFGWRPDELLGQNVKVLMPEHYARDHDDNIRHYVMGGPPRFIGSEREVEAQRKDGTVFPANLGITEVRLDSNRMFIGVIRDISEQKRAEQKLLENAAQLKAYYEQTENEQHLAKQLMNKQLHRRGLDDKHLRYMVLPAQNFSGDVVAATRSVEGRFYALLADATGHGLAAAISALPILSVFYRMAGFDRPVRELVQEFNLQLKESMPVGRFLAATVVCLDHEKRQGEIWVGGTPEAYLVNRHGDIARCFASIQLPLGIVDNRDINPNPVTFSWDRDSQLLLCSDGLLEAENVGHAPFGTDGLTQAIAGTSPKERFEAIHAALDRHLHQSMAADDVSLMLIDCP